MEAYAMYFIDLILHLDKHLPEIMMAYGHLIYAILFMVVFCETGLVVTPFLPGDSLLFACGALAAAAPEGMDIKIIVPIFLVSAVLGDACNYMIGEHLGIHMIKKNIIKKEHVDKASAFYDKHGHKAIFGPLCADCAYLCTLRCGHRQDALPDLCSLQCHRCRSVGISLCRRRLLFR